MKLTVCGRWLFKQNTIQPPKLARQFKEKHLQCVLFYLMRYVDKHCCVDRRQWHIWSGIHNYPYPGSEPPLTNVSESRMGWLGLSQKRPLLEASPISENLVLCIFSENARISVHFPSENAHISMHFQWNAFIFTEMCAFSCIFPFRKTLTR